MTLIVFVFAVFFIFCLALFLPLLLGASIFFYAPVVGAAWSVGVGFYILYYVLHDMVEILILRQNPLHPKSMITDIGERIPGFNVFYIASQASNNPFDRMKQYSY